MSYPGPQVRVDAGRRGTVALIAAILCSFVAILVTPFPRPDSPWRAFDLVLVPADEPLAPLRQRLEATGRTVIGADNATVRVEEFSETTARALASLPARFDEADPRLDPFLAAAPRLFRAGNGEQRYHVLYIARDGAPPISPLALARVLGETPFRLAGDNRVQPIVVGLGALMVMAVALVAARARRLPILAAVPVVLAASVGWGTVGVVRVALAAFAWAVWQDRRVPLERERLVYGGLASLRERLVASDAILALAALLYLASFFVVEGEPSLGLRGAALALLVPLSLAAISATAYFAHVRRVLRSEHRFFQPRPILTHARRESRPRSVTRVFLVATAIAIMTLAGNQLSGRILGAADGETLIPYPDHLLPDPSSPVDTTAAMLLPELRSTPPTRSPLSTAGYVAHRWYQDTLMWGGDFRVPAADEHVAIHRFELVDDTLTARLEPMVVADDAWVASLGSTAPFELYRLFVEEGGVFVVSARPYRATALSHGVLMRLALIAVGMPALLALGERLPKDGPVGTVQAQRRERQQA